MSVPAPSPFDGIIAANYEDRPASWHFLANIKCLGVHFLLGIEPNDFQTGISNFRQEFLTLQMGSNSEEFINFALTVAKMVRQTPTKPCQR